MTNWDKAWERALFGNPVRKDRRRRARKKAAVSLWRWTKKKAKRKRSTTVSIGFDGKVVRRPTKKKGWF